MDTKEQIAQVALSLFARQGYHGVSIRDIARAVGIKESSIYFHYASKQAIFDSLVAQAYRHMEGMKAAFIQRFDQVGEVTEEAFVAVGLHYLNSYFRDAQVRPLIDMLSMERFANEAAAEAWQALLFSEPLAHQTRIFAELQRRGIFRPADAALLAREYHYAVLGTFLSGDPEETLAALILRLYRREVVK